MADGFDLKGYRTGWIGKWHIDGHGRTAYIPPERRQRFHFEARECRHYQNSVYYLNDDPLFVVMTAMTHLPRPKCVANLLQPKVKTPMPAVILPAAFPCIRAAGIPRPL